MIRYIVDLTSRTEYPPELALKSLDNNSYDDVYLLETGEHPTSSYWLDWGGTYDTPTAQDAEIYFTRFLQKVYSRAAMLANLYTLLVEGNFIYMHLPRKPWQYLQTATEYNKIEPYASAPPDSSNPSDIYYDTVKHPVRLKIPSVPNKLSEPISGTTLQTTFSFTLLNNDGFFDDTEENNFINTPTRIKRSDVENPTLEDFTVIRYGLIDSVSVDGKQMKVKAADIYRTLTESATQKFTAEDYPSAPNSTLDKDIPIAWGSVKNIKLFEVDTNQYIALDPDYITAVSTVYDSDGASISFTFDSSTGIITATDAATADVTGAANNKIGEIITSEIEAKSDIPYIDGPWDKTEADNYISISAPVNFYFAGGEVKKLVTEVLKNDNAFLFTKNDGRLTLRQWGGTYGEHIIPSWQIMELPSKSNEEGKKYYSTAVTIQYDLDVENDTYNLEFFDDSQEIALAGLYRKKRNNTFPTQLANLSDVQDLATRLLDRFGTISDKATVKIGKTTADINILDTVILTLEINGRVMATLNGWIVREVDPAQDTLVLENFANFVVNDMILGDATATNFILGDADAADNILSQQYKYRTV